MFPTYLYFFAYEVSHCLFLCCTLSPSHFFSLSLSILLMLYLSLLSWFIHISTFCRWSFPLSLFLGCTLSLSHFFSLSLSKLLVLYISLSMFQFLETFLLFADEVLQCLSFFVVFFPFLHSFNSLFLTFYWFISMLKFIETFLLFANEVLIVSLSPLRAFKFSFLLTLTSYCINTKSFSVS